MTLKSRVCSIEYLSMSGKDAFPDPREYIAHLRQSAEKHALVAAHYRRMAGAMEFELGSAEFTVQVRLPASPSMTANIATYAQAPMEHISAADLSSTRKAISATEIREKIKTKKMRLKDLAASLNTNKETIKNLSKDPTCGFVIKSHSWVALSPQTEQPK